MEYSYEDVLNLFYIHGETGRFNLRTCRVFNERYPHLPRMTNKKFRAIQKNFLSYGKIISPQNLTKPITSNEDISVTILGYFNAFPRASIRSAEKDLGFSRPSIQRILKMHKMHDFKFCTMQELHQHDPLHRVEYCEWMIIKIQEEPNFLERIIWTDESKFTKEGVINRHNSHIWADENPFKIRTTNSQYKFCFNVFALLMTNRVYFFIYDQNLNGERYVDILRNQVENFLENIPLAELSNLWYQLDGAPAHCTVEVDRELNQMFQDRWIRRLGPWAWPPRSPDLTPLDFYLWGKIKQNVYATPVQTREELQARVILAFNTLDPLEIRRATVEGVERRIFKCLEANGAHFENML